MERIQKHSGGRRPGVEGLQASQLHRYAKAALISILFGELVTMGALLLFSLLLCRLEVPPAAADCMAVIAASMGALTAGCTCGRLLKEKGLLLGFICGGILLVIMLLFSVGFQQSAPVAALCVKTGIILLCAGFGGVLGVNRRKRIKC